MAVNHALTQSVENSPEWKKKDVHFYFLQKYPSLENYFLSHVVKPSLVKGLFQTPTEYLVKMANGSVYVIAVHKMQLKCFLLKEDKKINEEKIGPNLLSQLIDSLDNHVIEICCFKSDKDNRHHFYLFLSLSKDPISVDVSLENCLNDSTLKIVNGIFSIASTCKEFYSFSQTKTNDVYVKLEILPSKWNEKYKTDSFEFPPLFL